MTFRTLAGPALLLAVVALAGCSSQLAGMGLPTLDTAEAEDALGPASPEPLDGVLLVEANGCFHWHGAADSDADGAWIVWPDGARQDDDEVVLGDGARLGEDDGISGEGALVALADLPQGSMDQSYFGSFGRFCGADERGVLVLTRAEAGSPE